ncbi:MAG: hypothetical protein RI986_428, partial [Planctomycetota bacterium]
TRSTTGSFPSTPSERIPSRVNHGISAMRFACSCSGVRVDWLAGAGVAVGAAAGAGAAEGADAGGACSAHASASGSVMSAMAVMRTMIEKRSQYGACEWQTLIVARCLIMQPLRATVPPQGARRGLGQQCQSMRCANRFRPYREWVETRVQRANQDREQDS